MILNFRKKWKKSRSQFNGLVPVDHVAGQIESVQIGNVHISAFRSDV